MTDPVRLTTPPYGHVVHVLRCSRARGHKWLRSWGDKTPPADMVGAMAITFTPDRWPFDVCVWLSPEAPLATLVHEMVHAAVAVLRGSGVPVTSANDEIIAHLVEHLFEAYRLAVRNARA